MIRALQFLSDPFLAKRDEAEDLFDNRFRDDELDCDECYEGWKAYEGGFGRCNKCQGGSIYAALCIRCGLDDNNCRCNVEDFLR